MLAKLATKLQQARKSVGLSQNQVADHLGISRNKVINIEKGEVALDVLLLEKLAHLYGYTLTHFLEDDSVEHEDISFTFRATELIPEDSFVPAWGRRILLNLRMLQEISEEV